MPQTRADFDPSAPRRLERILLACSLLAVAVFIAVGIDRPVWLDEANSIRIASQPWSLIVRSLRHDNNLPVYYFLLSGWIHLFGNSEIALRSLSAIFFLTGGGVAFALGKHVASTTRGAWYTAFFYLCSPLVIRQAQNIRMYALLGMLSGLSTLFFVRLFLEQDRSWQARTLFVLVNAIGILTHLWFAFVLVAQLAVILIFERQHFRAWAASMVLAASPFLVLWSRPFLDQLHNGATNWMAMYPAALLVLAPLEFYGLPLATLYYASAVGLWISAEPARRKLLIEARRIQPLFVLFGVSLACPLLLSLFKPIYYPGRYAVIAIAPLAALLATVFSTLLPRAFLPLLCLPLLAAGLTSQYVHRDENPEGSLSPGQSDRSTAQFLLDHAAAGDAIVFTSLTRPAADYYFERASAAGRFIEISFPAENATHPGWADSSVPPGQRDALDTEAAATTQRLRKMIASGRHVWMYAGGSPLVSVILHHQLDSTLPPPRQYPLSGPYHTSILEYAAFPPGAVNPAPSSPATQTVPAVSRPHP